MNNRDSKCPSYERTYSVYSIELQELFIGARLNEFILDSIQKQNERLMTVPFDLSFYIEQYEQQQNFSAKIFFCRGRCVAILCFIFILLTILELSFELVVSASARVGEM